MFNIAAFLKDRKKILAVVAASIVAIALIAVTLNASMRENDGEMPPDVVNPYQLPETSDVSLQAQPILYDYVNGSLGLHEDLISMIDSNACFTLVSKDGSSKLFVVINYGHQSDDDFKNLLPIFSSAPIEIDLTAAEMASFENDLDALIDAGEIASVTEEGCTFYVIPYSVAFLGDAPNAIDFEGLISKYSPGELSKQIANGMGIPTEIIREKCDLQAIEEASGLDFSDPFWDNVNYGSRIKIHKRNDGSDYCIISPIYKKLVAGYGDPLNMFSVNDMDLMMTVDNLDQCLMENGYESINEALAAKDYATEEEFKEKQGIYFAS